MDCAQHCLAITHTIHATKCAVLLLVYDLGVIIIACIAHVVPSCIGLKPCSVCCNPGWPYSKSGGINRVCAHAEHCGLLHQLHRLPQCQVCKPGTAEPEPDPKVKFRAVLCMAADFGDLQLPFVSSSVCAHLPVMPHDLVRVHKPRRYPSARQPFGPTSQRCNINLMCLGCERHSNSSWLLHQKLMPCAASLQHQECDHKL